MKSPFPPAEPSAPARGSAVRRVSGGLLVPAVVHGLFDFSILPASVAGDTLYAGGIASILAYPVVAIILVVRRRRIEPSVAGETAARSPTPRPRRS